MRLAARGVRKRNGEVEPVEGAEEAALLRTRGQRIARQSALYALLLGIVLYLLAA